MKNPSKVIASLWPQSLVTITKLIVCAWIVSLALSAGIIGSFWGLFLFCALIFPSTLLFTQKTDPLFTINVDNKGNTEFHAWKSTTDEEPDFVPVVQPA